MCGRFVHEFTWKQLHDYLAVLGVPLTSDFTELPGPRPSYNVAPTATVPVIRAVAEGALAPAMMRWWLVPSWSKSDQAKYATFNARSEDAASKPAFRSPFRRRRCVVPVSGFYEWQKTDEGKQPHYIRRADGRPLMFAGLWDRWGELESCTILTTVPNAEMKQLHHRMPCILEPEQLAGWCDPELEDLDQIQAKLRPAADGILETHQASMRVNNARTANDPELTRPI